MSDNRVPAAALAAFGAASAIPIPLAQFDFAGLVNAFDIDSGDSPRALLVMAGVGGFLTIAVLALAFAGAGLALAGAPTARALLITAALAGLVTAMPLWIPTGVVIGAAAILLGQPSSGRAATGGGNVLGSRGVTTRTPRQGEV
ncbi:MAG TPA: hypothetical protein VNB88_11175 [Gaiellaceae bacterium]|jgi:hypothetical protein|nr:hypothetical protein [Gaiellaceae bacterium]